MGRLSSFAFVACLPMLACGQGSDNSRKATADADLPSGLHYFQQPQRLPMPDSKIPGTVSPYLVVDQMGYLPNAPKVAILRDPQKGHDAAGEYSITGKQYKLIDVRTGAETALKTPVEWQAGNPTDKDSGDRGWWLDFSEISKPGHYYLSDGSARSYSFVIDPLAYRPALRAGLRMFYYNRHNIAKEARWSDVTLAGTRPWTDGASGKPFATAQDVDNKVAGTQRDLSGGWADAGDSNKYVTFAFESVHILLAAYDLMPAVFDAAEGGDAYDIPESGNGVPDLLDEVKWEIDWLKRMCDANGACIIKTGYSRYKDELGLATANLLPSQNPARRYWTGYDCSSANIAAASMFAHAAATFRRSQGKTGFDKAYLADLEARAIAGFARFEQQRTRVQGPRPYTNDCDTDYAVDDGNSVHAGDADTPFYDTDSLQQSMAVTAAIYLHELSGKPDDPYNSYVDRYIGQMKVMLEGVFSSRSSDAAVLSYYLRMPGSTPATQERVRSRLLAFLKDGGGANLTGTDTTSLYRNRIKDFVYGSNSERMTNSIANLMPRFDPALAVKDRKPYENRALQGLNYVHGANPFNIAYLTNMNGPPYYLGRSVRQMYHYWAVNGSPRFDQYDPDNIQKSPGPMPGYFMPGPSGTTQLFDTAGGIQCTRIQALANRCPSPPFASPGNNDITAQPREKRWAEINNVNYPGDMWYVAAEPILSMNAQYLFVAAAFAQGY